MKYALEIQKIETRAKAEGEARGEARGKAEGKAEGKMQLALELALDMLETSDDLEYISKIFKLPIEYVQALNEVCSVDSIMEQYFQFDFE